MKNIGRIDVIQKTSEEDPFSDRRFYRVTLRRKTGRQVRRHLDRMAAERTGRAGPPGKTLPFVYPFFTAERASEW